MAYLRPPAFTRAVVNRLAMSTGMFGTATLVVAGRTTGEPRKVPVVPIEVDGDRYLVSTRGESEWVRNVRAAGAVTVRHKGDEQRYDTVEIDVDARPPIIDAYRDEVGRAVKGYFEKLPDPGDHPVFRLDPA